MAEMMENAKKEVINTENRKQCLSIICHSDNFNIRFL